MLYLIVLIDIKFPETRNSKRLTIVESYRGCIDLTGSSKNHEDDLKRP